MEKKKIVIYQGDPMGIDLTYEDMVERWENGLAKMPEIEYKIVKQVGRPTMKEYHQNVGDADALLGVWINADIVNEELFANHPNLKYVATLGHGFGEFDAEMTKRYGATITNTIYGDVTIAQYAIALLMNICHNVTLQSAYSKEGYWKMKQENPSVRYNQLFQRQIELYQKTMGIIGLGAIGFWTAKMAAGLGMKVIAYSRHKKTGEEYDFIEQTDTMDELLERSDVISIHCPYTKENDKMIGKEAFDKMKDGVIIINTARGALIDEDALLEALNSRKVYMAGLDVVAQEPPVERIPLMESEYTYITSHIAWQPRESRLRAIDLALENYAAYLRGEARSVINK